MKNFLRSASTLYRLLVAGIGLSLLILSTLIAPPTQWWGLLIAAFIAFQVNYPLNILVSEINLVQVIALGTGLLFGPAVAGWAVVLGIAIGCTIRWFRPRGFSQRALTTQSWILEAVFAVGVQTISLVTALLVVQWDQGIAGQLRTGDALGVIWPAGLVPVLLFAFLQMAFFLGDVLLHPSQPVHNLRRDLAVLSLVEILPLPFVLINVLTYAVTPTGSIILLGGIPTILTILMYEMNKTSHELERRLQDLSTLNNVSQVLRSTLNLDQLLEVIHQQVTHLLGVDSFYVALFDNNQKRIWYPLAVKFGQRQQWPPRSLIPDRLTDRVIQEGKPLWISPKSRDELAQSGMPTGDPIQAWMGVPLISSERTIGCLAVFSYLLETEFTRANLDLLTILSGQVSVAIQNALLYDQTQRRATQLETLNRLTALITASLDTQEVLAQVCRAAAKVSGGQKSAIYLLDPESSRANLSYAFGFSNDFARQQNESGPLSHPSRTRSLRTGRPALTTDINNTTLERELLFALRREGIQAYGDFPLSTPDGQIGILSTYFDVPHNFLPEEVELLQTLASQAALSVSNARLYASTDKALARRVDQLAILETVGRELAAAISSSRLFDMILDFALQYTKSPWGELTLYNAQTNLLEVKASRGYQTGPSVFSLDDGVTGRAVKTRQAVYVSNCHKEPGYLDYAGGAALSQLSVPLIREGRVLGVLTIESAEENAYSPNDQAFINQLTNQAAVAVVNAELYNETQRRLREQTILYLISTHLVGNPELDSIMRTVAHSMETAEPGATIGVYLWDELQSSYILRFINPSTRSNCQLPHTILEASLGAMRPSLLHTGPLRPTGEQRGTKPLLGNCRECNPLVLPMVVKRQRLGMILLHLAKERQIQDHELQLLHSMVAQVSLSMQNALLFQDVTQGRDQLAAVLNSVDEGLLMMESGGRILLVNEPVQKITGLTRDDLIGKQLMALPSPTLKLLGYTDQEANALTKRLIDQPQVFPKTTVKVSDLKPERYLERSTVPVLGQGGLVIGWMIVLRDVTEELQINEARELITETLVHDLRSPMSSVLGAVDILEDSIVPEHKDELIEQALRVARGSTQRVLGLVESLLDIARLKAGKMDLNLSPVNLYTLSKTTLNEFINQATETGIILRNNIPADLPAVHADQSKMTRVLTNLLDNALKFTPPGGQVTISAELQPADTIRVSVSDTGPGIPEEFREKIFERFTQVPGQRGRRRGSGLGLTFCRLAIEAHGGRIWVEPRDGEGSIFSLTLPVNGPPGHS